MEHYILKINEYTNTPYSREEAIVFRETYLKRMVFYCIKNNKKLLLDFDNVFGYKAAFIDELFCIDYIDVDSLLDLLIIKCEEFEYIKKDIINRLNKVKKEQEKREKEVILKLSDFNINPCSREDAINFKMLIKDKLDYCINNNKKLVVDLDGIYSFTNMFLNELLNFDFIDKRTLKKLKNILIIKYDDYEYLDNSIKNIYKGKRKDYGKF